VYSVWDMVIGKYVNMSQAARLLGVTRVTVYNMVRRGELDVVMRVTGLPYLSTEQVKDLAKKRGSGECG